MVTHPSENPPQSDVISTLQKDGVFVLENAITPENVENIRIAATWFLAQNENWLQSCRLNEDNYAIISPRLVPRQHIGKLRTISNFFCNSFFEDVCKGYMSKQYNVKDVVIDRIIVSKSTVSDKPVTLWHADQQDEGRKSFKFMLYLSDTNGDNGAFSYVKGTQNLVHDIVSKAAPEGIANTDLHSFEQISGAIEKLGNLDQKQELDNMRAHIKGDCVSDDHYSISAGKGSALLFDTRGIHRGGCVRKEERLLIRVHCFEAPLTDKSRPWLRRALSALKNMLRPKPFSWGLN